MAWTSKYFPLPSKTYERLPTPSQVKMPSNNQQSMQIFKGMFFHDLKKIKIKHSLVVELAIDIKEAISYSLSYT